MKKLLFAIVAFSSTLASCVTGGAKKDNSGENDNTKDSLILRQDTTGLVRVHSSGGYDTLVHKDDVKKVQDEHHSRYIKEGGKGSFHSFSRSSVIEGDTHYSCSHYSHYSSSYNHNLNY